jgi:AIG2-like family
VFVAMYDVTDADALQMDRWEAADLALFRKIRVRVATLDGDAAAWLYVLDDYEGGLPSARYLGLIADAAEAAGAPDDYVSELRARPCRSVGPGS